MQHEQNSFLLHVDREHHVAAGAAASTNLDQAQALFRLADQVVLLRKDKLLWV